MSLKPPPPPPPQDAAPDLELTIRFSASLPDLLLTIPGSLHANTATLKQLIRSRLPSEYATRRIRLIYAGKALVDDVPLATALLRRNVSRPPSRISTSGPYDEAKGNNNGPRGAQSDAGNHEEGKGKLPLRDPPAQPRIYIHCSIGDIELSPPELAAEAACGAEDDIDHDTTSTSNTNGASTSKTSASASAAMTTTTPAPRGFERLLNAGFTPAEVQSLRLQFLAIQAHTHTPDTMPSPNTLRDMEDRWLDGSDANVAGGADHPGGVPGGAAGGDDDMQTGALDDMIWGTAMGFFWPIGCLMWGVREEGIWSQRRKMAVVVGFMLNVGLGIIRYTG